MNCVLRLAFMLVVLRVCQAFLYPASLRATRARASPLVKKVPSPAYGKEVSLRTSHICKDILGLGAPEIALCLVAALVLFGPETLKSLSKDVGKAAAELKEIPKTFKEGMDEGSEAVQIAKMKAIAAEKRRKRDEKLAEEAESDNVQP